MHSLCPKAPSRSRFQLRPPIGLHLDADLRVRPALLEALAMSSQAASGADTSSERSVKSGWPRRAASTAVWGPNFQSARVALRHSRRTDHEPDVALRRPGKLSPVRVALSREPAAPFGPVHGQTHGRNSPLRTITRTSSDHHHKRTVPSRGPFAGMHPTRRLVSARPCQSPPAVDLPLGRRRPPARRWPARAPPSSS